MRLGGQRSSSNVEDRRGMGGGVAVGGGIGGLLILLLTYLLGGGGGGTEQLPIPQPSQTYNRQATPADDQMATFVSKVLASTEDVWRDIFQAEGEQYVDPRLVLFTDRVQSACGIAGSASGPFYCPLDSKVYIDLSFYQELRNRFKAPGDFAQAYVIAHEVGHHVQNLLGISDQVQNAQRRARSQAEANELSVRLELQADYFAGVWARHAQNQGLLEVGDIEEAINAAGAIGDDRLQRESQGHVVPDAFTHGTSEQRIRWFKKGFQAGNVEGGDTFSPEQL